MPKLCLRACALMALAFAVTAGSPRAQPGVPTRWSVAIDSRDQAGPWLSVRHRTIYAVRDAHVVAIEIATGRIRWTSKDSIDSRPAIGGRTIFAAVVKGIVALDMATGRETGRLRSPQTPSLAICSACATRSSPFGSATLPAVGTGRTTSAATSCSFGALIRSLRSMHGPEMQSRRQTGSRSISAVTAARCGFRSPAAASRAWI